MLVHDVLHSLHGQHGLCQRPRGQPCNSKAAWTHAAQGRQQQVTIQQHQQRQYHSLHGCVSAGAVSSAAADRAASYEWSWQQKGRNQFLEAGSKFDQDQPLPQQMTLQDVVRRLQLAVAALESATAHEGAAPTTDTPAAALQAQTAATAAAADQDTGGQAAAVAAAASRAANLPSQAWLDALLSAAQPLLQEAPGGPAATAACAVLGCLSQLDYTPEASWMNSTLQGVCGNLQELSTQQLSGLMWSLSNLRHVPAQQHWQEILTAAQSRLEEFYGPDLALLVCGAGSVMSSSSSSFEADGGVRSAGSAQQAQAAAGTDADSSSSPVLTLPPGWSDAVLSEVEYQVTEFPADLSAFDLARIASGLADLGISPSKRLQDSLMKAVYARTRTIEEKGAVDFALAKLDAKGKKSMFYDPRWTHEELKWLPRRERDKRRILKDGWYRTQWSGWRAG